jgi:hypothetical protein
VKLDYSVAIVAQVDNRWVHAKYPAQLTQVPDLHSHDSLADPKMQIFTWHSTMKQLQ